MGRTPSTTHRWLFHVKATSATLLTRNSALKEMGRGIGKIGGTKTTKTTKTTKITKTTKTTEKLGYQKTISTFSTLSAVPVVSILLILLILPIFPIRPTLKPLPSTHGLSLPMCHASLNKKKCRPKRSALSMSWSEITRKLR